MILYVCLQNTSLEIISASSMRHLISLPEPVKYARANSVYYLINYIQIYYNKLYFKVISET